jgi:hypothetical protein
MHAAGHSTLSFPRLRDLSQGRATSGFIVSHRWEAVRMVLSVPVTERSIRHDDYTALPAPTVARTVGGYDRPGSVVCRLYALSGAEPTKSSDLSTS